MGNFLDKPTLLLKRNFIRDTNFDNEVLQDGGAYAAQAADMPEMAAGAPPPMPSMMMAKKKRKAAPRGLGITEQNNQIQGFQNFLATNACLMSN